MKRFGLIGKTLKHSFSKQYFEEKFSEEGIFDCEYQLYELDTIAQFEQLSQMKDLVGLNVTIPYKKEIIPFLDEIDEHAQKIEAVNTVKFLPNGKLKGYNTDYHGFKSCLLKWELKNVHALVLGTGGASNAIMAALNDLSIPFKVVSRQKKTDAITYKDLNDQGVIQDHLLIINTTPLGTYPDIKSKPDIPYHHLTRDHKLFDLV